MLALFNESIAEAIDNSCIYPPDKMFALSSKFIYSKFAIFKTFFISSSDTTSYNYI